MTKQTFLLRYPFVFFITLILLGSCNNADKSAVSEPATTAASKTSTEVMAQPTASIFSGKLDTLVVDSSAFTKLPAGKTVFVFALGGLDTLTLAGWNAKGKNEDSFALNPNIRLLKRGPTSYSYGPGTYFANLILKGKDLKEIQDSLSSKHNRYRFVVFLPKSVDGHISYEISVSKDDALDKTTPIALVTTTATANPSPPKQY
jgi:hypothetical protein